MSITHCISSKGLIASLCAPTEVIQYQKIIQIDRANIRRKNALPSQPAHSRHTYKSFKHRLNTVQSIATNSSQESSPDHQSPSPSQLQRPLGIDYGKKRIGLALSSLGIALRTLPPLLKSYTTPQSEIALQIIEIAKTQGCDGFIVGIPVTQRGSLSNPQTDSEQGKYCRSFANTLASLAGPRGFPVYVVDETGTSAEATNLLGLTARRHKSELKQKKDSMSAALILDSYYDGASEAILINKPR